MSDLCNEQLSAKSNIGILELVTNDFLQRVTSKCFSE